MINKTLVKVNGIIITVCASWASVNTEFNLPPNKWITALDWITMAWSAIILATTTTKLVTIDRKISEDFPNLRDVLLLNYVPLIKDFGRLYYSMLLVGVGIPFIWRVYLNILRPMFDKKPHPKYDAKRKLVQFLIEGPRISPHGQLNIGTIASVFAHCISPSEEAKIFAHRPEDCVYRDGVPSRETIHSAYFSKKNRSLLTYLYDSHDFDSADPYTLDQVYENPMKSNNFFSEYSQSRWKYLFKHVYCWNFGVCLYALPIFWCVGIGFNSVSGRFGAHHLITGYWATAIYLYGVSEQIYACCQTALFLTFTNLFVTLFHADLVFKARPIRRGLERINMLYLNNCYNYSLAFKEDIQRQQLRIWAFFDDLTQLDTYVSKYSLISMILFVVSMSFGQSYFTLEDAALKTGTAAVMLSNFISFSFLYIISWDIEKRSNAMHKTVMSIVAREPDFATMRIWQKTLFGFYERDSKRTFTLDSRTPLNLHLYFKTLFGLMTMSLVLNRLLAKRETNA